MARDKKEANDLNTTTQQNQNKRLTELDKQSKQIQTRVSQFGRVISFDSEWLAVSTSDIEVCIDVNYSYVCIGGQTFSVDALLSAQRSLRDKHELFS